MKALSRPQINSVYMFSITNWTIKITATAAVKDIQNYI